MISSRQDLIDYALRRLGAPVLEINIDDDQITDRLDEALQVFQDFHGDAVERSYIKYQVTAADITNEYINLSPANINGVIITHLKKVLQFDEGSFNDALFNLDYQIRLTDIYDLKNGGSIANYVQTKQYLSLLDSVMDGEEHIRYNRHSDRLYIEKIWGRDIIEGQWIIIEAFIVVDPELSTGVYNDLWLKKYFTQLIKLQWGTNLKKFDGMQLPGGVTINATATYEEAMEEIEKLEEELRLNWELPIDFISG